MVGPEKTTCFKWKGLFVVLSILFFLNGSILMAKKDEQVRQYKLFVITSPDDAEIRFLGNERPTGPAFSQGIRLRPGTYEIEVSYPGYISQRKSVEIKNNDVTIEVRLTRQGPIDDSPPEIIITSHDVSRGIKVKTGTNRTTVAGRVIDSGGIAEVTVNGETIPVDGFGNFTLEVILAEGENLISVTARDTSGNISKKDFIVVADGGNGSGNTGRYYALIIGLKEYRHLPRLKTPHNDARSVARILKSKYGFDTRVLLDATRDEILEKLNDFRRKLKPEDNFLIYYAGHGEFEERAGKAYWLPIDAKQDDDTKWIIVDTVTANIKRIAAKHVLIISDSCYSGTFTRRNVSNLSPPKNRKQFLEKILDRKSRTLMSSGGKEPVTDIGGRGHSVFADVFLRALEEVEGSVFTAEELFYGYIKESVGGRSEQLPEYSNLKNSGHDGGDFIFIKKN